MTHRTRYFVIVSLLVLASGLGTGLVAYYVGFPAAALGRTAAVPTSSKFVPRNAAVVAYAKVQRHHDLRAPPEASAASCRCPGRTASASSRTRPASTSKPTSTTSSPASPRPDTQAGMVLARGRFNDVKIEALMREHGAEVEDYKGERLSSSTRALRTDTRMPLRPTAMSCANASFAVAFIEPGLVAIGSIDARQKRRIDLQKRRVDNVTANEELMNLVRRSTRERLGGRPVRRARRPGAAPRRAVPASLPPITWFSASGHVDGGISGVAARRNARRRGRRTTCATWSAASWPSRRCRRDRDPSCSDGAVASSWAAPARPSRCRSTCRRRCSTCLASARPSAAAPKQLPVNQNAARASRNCRINGHGSARRSVRLGIPVLR